MRKCLWKPEEGIRFPGGGRDMVLAIKMASSGTSSTINNCVISLCTHFHLQKSDAFMLMVEILTNLYGCNHKYSGESLILCLFRRIIVHISLKFSTIFFLFRSIFLFWLLK